VRSKDGQRRLRQSLEKINEAFGEDLKRLAASEE
jgi:hypothetical protein